MCTQNKTFWKSISLYFDEFPINKMHALGLNMKVGDIAPDFTLDAHDGTSVQLSQFRGKYNVVLFFYPKDDTPG